MQPLFSYHFDTTHNYLLLDFTLGWWKLDFLEPSNLEALIHAPVIGVSALVAALVFTVVVISPGPNDPTIIT